MHASSWEMVLLVVFLKIYQERRVMAANGIRRLGAPEASMNDIESMRITTHSAHQP